MPLAELDARARADAALRRIRNGSDPAREAFDLAEHDERRGRRSAQRRGPTVVPAVLTGSAGPPARQKAVPTAAMSSPPCPSALACA